MKCKIKDTGEIKELAVFDRRGNDYLPDIIIDDTLVVNRSEYWEMSLSSYRWWCNWVHEEEKINIKAEELGIDWESYGIFNIDHYEVLEEQREIIEGLSKPGPGVLHRGSEIGSLLTLT